MRYKLMIVDNKANNLREVDGERRSTSKQIEEWIQSKIKSGGLDWRVGFMVKFRSEPTVYSWQWIKDSSDVKCWRK
jgi:hypothetical protein